LENLSATQGQHLVIVRYSANHNPFREFVFNDADIDQARIVWARDMGDEKNAELTGYFRHRHIWLLEGDLDPPFLSAYR